MGTARSMGRADGAAPRARLTVRELMTPTEQLVAVTPETSLLEAADIFLNRGIHGAPVVAGDALLGVVSASALLDFAATAQGIPGDDGGDAEWGEADEPADDDDAGGSWADEARGGARAFARPESRNVLEDFEVRDVMTRGVSIPPDASVRQAARAMLRAGVGRLLVVGGGELLGLLSVTDIIRAVASGRLTPAAPRRPPG